ncbi:MULTISPECIES: DUF397 domain-containing protein [Nocardiopsis]|uniref:DUF397 domain-containing protein n=1 Tax=Nocardiopsis sinuspersici TaxID=501010 RepID=A0A1V3BX20_9ACTN|nr:MULTISPECIES: DUF397 domain-containing protein [Nocardiopsis]NYH53802.1 hypothetical protein [Nocardiopsis sinuspersici]OOC52726.1 DUF397 domain-containing protein [Nocardiopsis sinuspersici]
MTSEWHKSSYSSTGGQCVEVREHEAGTDVRDSVHPDAGCLSFPPAQWVSLTTHADTV